MTFDRNLLGLLVSTKEGAVTGSHLASFDVSVK